ncbi:hypothetical protein GQ54DRAFT_51753 [Martensiomyces pterosporus]|nr:hypothetical protein GQ54DRAFT_51753 [Martensiomyces pterosporus]
MCRGNLQQTSERACPVCACLSLLLRLHLSHNTRPALPNLGPAATQKDPFAFLRQPYIKAPAPRVQYLQQRRALHCRRTHTNWRYDRPEHY